MDEPFNTIIVAVVRESVSLTILLVFGFLAYRLVDRLFIFLEQWGKELIDVLKDIANSKK